jgi:signal transduction histidine kinase
MIFIGLEKYSENALKVIIRDNGVGIDKTSKQNSQTGKDLHLGIDLTFSRLGIIGRNMNIPTQAEIYEVNPLSPNPGTEVRMIVPLT